MPSVVSGLVDYNVSSRANFGVLSVMPCLTGDATVVLPLAEWESPEKVSAWVGSLPAVKCVSGLWERAWGSGAVNGPFFGIMRFVLAEWLGLFGYVPGQVVPGLRLPLPRPVCAEVWGKRSRFDFFSDLFWRRVAPGRGFDFTCVQDGLLMHPFLNLLADVRVFRVSQLNPASGVVRYVFRHPAGRMDGWELKDGVFQWTGLPDLPAAPEPVSLAEVLPVLLLADFGDRDFLANFRYSSALLPRNTLGNFDQQPSGIFAVSAGSGHEPEAAQENSKHED
jgi:hypothetical protein